MQRNTTILITFLAVFAAIVVGVNLGRSSRPQPIDRVTPTPPLTNVPKQIQLISYEDSICGISAMYPETLTKIDIQTGGATFVNTTDASQAITIVCQNEIPRVPLPADKIETVQIGTISANLYHDASQKDGTPIDKLIFTHPKTKKDVYIAGFGDTYNKLIQTITVNF